MDNKNKEAAKKHPDAFGVDQAIMVLEKHNRRDFFLIIVLIAALIITNGAWIYRESTFETTETTTEITQDVDANGDGSATLKDGVNINNGTHTTDSENHN